MMDPTSVSLYAKPSVIYSVKLENGFSIVCNQHFNIPVLRGTSYNGTLHQTFEKNIFGWSLIDMNFNSKIWQNTKNLNLLHSKK